MEFVATKKRKRMGEKEKLEKRNMNQTNEKKGRKSKSLMHVEYEEKNTDKVNKPHSNSNFVKNKDEKVKKNSNGLELQRGNAEFEKKGNVLKSKSIIENKTTSKLTQTTKKKPTLIEKMKARLQSAHFRKLNEMLYTCKSDDAQKLFKNTPQAFVQYHDGYNNQISSWPIKPIDEIIKWIKKRKNDSLKIADFGCGEAKLASSIKNKVFSFDFVSSKPEVIACNMANTPLHDNSIDICVFCLSLMGIDYSKYLMEAFRVLNNNGWLLIAEVKSRFDANNGGASPLKFVKTLKSIGFSLKSEDDSNKMFIMWVFKKQIKQNSATPNLDAFEWPALKPCLYKRR